MGSPENPPVDVAIVGGGVVGVACGAELARTGRSVVVIEQHGACGLEASSRNSGVIHAGLYYPTGSLKAQCCTEGRDRLYARCHEQSLPHRRTGKLVVATMEPEIERLDAIGVRATANGVPGIERLDARALRAREPRVSGRAALWVPVSGIVDAHALVSSYQAELERHEGRVVLHTRVDGLEPRAGAWRIDTRNASGESYALEAGAVVNAAGLGAERIAALAGIDVARAGYRLHPCKGDYFAVAPSLGALTNHLVYPIPAGGGLGVHVTMDLGGRFLLGPDAEYVDEISYAVRPDKAERFAEAARRYLPEIRAADLTPDSAGIRCKLAGPEDDFRDFVIAEESARGAPGLVDLLGIESPGLTSAAAIARRVAALI